MAGMAGNRLQLWIGDALGRVRVQGSGIGDGREGLGMFYRGKSDESRGGWGPKAFQPCSNLYRSKNSWIGFDGIQFIPSFVEGLCFLPC
jgi:hypothetical protein